MRGTQMEHSLILKLLQETLKERFLLAVELKAPMLVATFILAPRILCTL